MRDRGRRRRHAPALGAASLGVAGLLSCGVPADAPPPAEDPRLACARAHPAPPRYQPVIRALCAELHNLKGVAAAVAIADHDRVVWSTAVGPRCQGQPEPLTPTTSMRVGSITKTVTAALALAVARRQGQGLDGDLRGLLPELRRPVTLRQLLSHTSGLRDVDPVELLRREDRWMDALDEHRQAPGAHHYANANFTVAGRWLERASGRSLAELLATEPAATELRERLVLRDRGAAGHSCGHRRAPGGWLPVMPEAEPPLPGWTIPAGGGFASVEDLARLPFALERTGWLSAMTDRTVPTDRPGWRYGLGLRVRQVGEALTLGHTGNTGAFAAELEWSPGRGISVAIISSTEQHLKATFQSVAAIELHARPADAPTTPLP